VTEQARVQQRRDLARAQRVDGEHHEQHPTTGQKDRPARTGGQPVQGQGERGRQQDQAGDVQPPPAGRLGPVAGDGAPGRRQGEQPGPREGDSVSDIARSAERSAVMRLIIVEASHFPELVRSPPEQRPVQRALADRLADRLAELAERGLLRVPDPLKAAEFLGLLVTGRVNHRSWYGAVPLEDAESDRLVDGGVRIFLRAYGTH
jgi:AefR-like transcriptional repressor, C-terminal domain